MVDVTIETGGSSVPDIVYVYSMTNDKPHLLWSFASGDRAEGGLKRAFVDDGRLSVELFGDDSFQRNKWRFSTPEGNFHGLCCPSMYTRFNLRWDGAAFRLSGTPEKLAYDWKSRPNEN